MSRQARGRSNLLAGAAAEAVAERHYAASGGRVLARRWRGPEGELDLVVEAAGVLVFVEVKRRRRAELPDSPVTLAQWRRLEATAERYMMAHANQTGAMLGCRFDLALVGPDGAVRIIENARTFEQ